MSDGAPVTDPTEVDTSSWDDDDPRPWRKHSDALAKKVKEQEAANQEAMAKLARYERREAFEHALSEAKVEGVELTLEDFEGLPAEQISAVAIRMKAEEKAGERSAALETQAKALGFASAEEFQVALDKVTAMDSEKRASLITQSSVAQAGAPGPAPTKTPEEAGWDAYKEAKGSGKAEDKAQAEYLRAHRETSVTSAN